MQLIGSKIVYKYIYIYIDIPTRPSWTAHLARHEMHMAMQTMRHRVFWSAAWRRLQLRTHRTWIVTQAVFCQKSMFTELVKKPFTVTDPNVNCHFNKRQNALFLISWRLILIYVTYENSVRSSQKSKCTTLKKTIS